MMSTTPTGRPYKPIPSLAASISIMPQPALASARNRRRCDNTLVSKCAIGLLPGPAKYRSLQARFDYQDVSTVLFNYAAHRFEGHWLSNPGATPERRQHRW